MVALVFGTGVIAQAQAAEEPEGPVVQIGQADEGTTTPGIEQHDAQGVEHAVPKYWIGLGVGVISPDHVLRAYVDLPEGQGLLVGTVAPDSPAAKAGLKQHDILLRANGTDLHELHDLTDLVSTEGANKGKITLDIVRKSGPETVAVTPEDRPESAQRPQFGGGEGFGGFGAEGLPQELLQRFQGGGPIEFRNFGGGQGIGNMPEGVSVSISKEGDKPTHITVKRGDETWEVTEGDKESLEKLPEDLRPHVEQMLHGASPFDLHNQGAGPRAFPNGVDGQIRDRMERMEKQMEQMMERLNQNRQAPKDAEESK
jgi:membrane-associated protease RseP (regulator of RpoE activity)